ncbi:phosphotransferase [Streptomyces sp. NBC_01235]|uniref:phosphotransferase n=1 Tax=Streptomyces sp. NBC_01235 TaxID=2903788 RepID=UPI002E0EA273|nr:phosphotransferase [Streptomyces sp. NBC_01235]
MPVTGRLLGSGRTADVYEIDEAWVLRRDREGWGDAAAEGAVMAHVREYGYPAPAVRTSPSCSRTDLVMERLEGPTMLQAFAAGTLDAEEAGAVLARLLRALHAVPGRVSADARILHLDLHPDNVMLTPDGPRVIDWANAEEGDPGLDWGMSAVILAQVAVSAQPIAAPARTMLAALLADPCDLTEEGLAQALRRRAANPTMSREETELLGPAGELIRSLMV